MVNYEWAMNLTFLFQGYFNENIIVKVEDGCIVLQKIESVSLPNP